MKKWWKGLRMTIAGFIWKGNIETIFEKFEKLAKTYDANKFIIVTALEFKQSMVSALGFAPQYLLPSRDLLYYALPEPLLLEFNKLYSQIRPRPKGEAFDCDNYSMDYMAFLSRFAAMIPNVKGGFAIGMMDGRFPWYKGFHQANILYTHTGEVKLLEPQTMKLYPVEVDGIRALYY